MAKLEAIEGIGDVYAEKLRSAGIRGTNDLLKKAGTKQGRQALAELAGVSEKLVLEWVNHADLFRIKGVGPEYADLLEEAGVDTVVELAQRNPENLYNKIVEINEAKKLVRRLPTLDMVKAWVAQAKQLPRAIEY